MLRKIVGLFVVVGALVAVPIALSQMEQGQVVYTFVSQFQVQRANWAQYSENTDKTFVPIAEKLVADGTIVSYSTFETIVHTPDGMTHGAAWSSTSIAGLTKVLDEVRKVGPQPGQIAATKHEDLLMQSTMHVGKSGSGTSGYARVVCQMAKADRPDDYPAAIKKLLWSTFEEQFKNGAASAVSLDSQYINNGPPSLRCLVVTYPNAEGMDKWANAVNAALGKMGPADREALFGSVVADSRRDFLFRVTHYRSK
jgi:hypothetical protein